MRRRSNTIGIIMAAALSSIAAASLGQTARPTNIGLDSVEAEHYGRRLIAETFALIGPEVADPAMRYAGNNLACQNCHTDGGTKSYALSLVGVYEKYPRYSARAGREVSLAARINDCMTHSMNGRPLPEAGPEMVGMIAYLRLLAADAGAYGNPVEEPVKMPELDRPADPVRGARLFDAECAACHGTDGLGMRNGQPGDALGYQHPPLWGPDSFNAGAGMAQLITAANFVHDNMPPGTSEAAPTLRAEDAWDIAAYVESHPRPPGPDLPRLFPKPFEKPVDAAFAPHVEGIGDDQHRYGPFQPIRDKIAEMRGASGD